MTKNKEPTDEENEVVYMMRTIAYLRGIIKNACNIGKLQETDKEDIIFELEKSLNL